MTDLSQAARNLWGKKETRAGQQLWLPLVAHLIDTKNVINWLFNHWLSESQKNILYINHSEEDTQDLIFPYLIHKFHPIIGRERLSSKILV